MKIDDLKDVFELAATTGAFINELMKIKSTSKNNYEDDAKIKSSGDWAKVASSGNSAQVASSGNNAKVASSGDWAKVASSGNNAKVASSGNYAQVASSGAWAKVASSGDWAKVASSGNNAKVASSGNNAVVAAIGKLNMACAKKVRGLRLLNMTINTESCTSKQNRLTVKESKKMFSTLFATKNFTKLKKSMELRQSF